MEQVYKYLLVGGMPEAVLRSRTLFQNIYKELNKESKNFSPGLIEEKSKTRDFATSIQWLTMAHIVNQSFQLKEHITMPLMPGNESHFRLFLGDIGMFSYSSAGLSLLLNLTINCIQLMLKKAGELLIPLKSSQTIISLSMPLRFQKITMGIMQNKSCLRYRFTLSRLQLKTLQTEYFQ